MNETNFNNLLKVLRREKTSRPVLFEFIIGGTAFTQTLGTDVAPAGSPFECIRNRITCFHKLGYDYATIPAWDPSLGFLSFKAGEQHQAASVSMNEGAVISDRSTFESFDWTDPNPAAYKALAGVKSYVPKGMKLITCGPCGVLENTIRLVGFENLCYLIADEPELVTDICSAIGTRLLKHYQLCLEHEVIGAAIVNDDWGFKTQTMLSTADMRKFIIPWHKKIVEAIHAAGRPAILHSCGQLSEVWDDLIDDIRFDAKHSYEDAILPVEQAYDRYSHRIAIMGGIDVDFLCRAKPEEIYKRSKAMLEHTASKGGYALGSGNSITNYMPAENYFAMIRAAQQVT